MTDTKQRTRTKPLTAAEIMTHLEKLPLRDQLAVMGNLKADIEATKKSLQEDIELVRDFVSLGYTFTFTKEPFNMSIKISKGDQAQESWLPADHQDESSITRCIAFMIDKMHTEETKT